MKKIIFMLLIITSIIFARNNSVVIYGDGATNAVTQTSRSLDVMLSDPTTPPVDAYFLKVLTNFSLISNAIPSTITNLNYTIFISNGGQVKPGSEIVLNNTESTIEFYATVISTNVNGAVVLDRPLDNYFSTNCTNCYTATSEMAVDGSATPQIFSVRGGSVPIDITRILLVITDTTAMDDGKFGGITKLSRGVVVRVIDSYNKVLFNWKNNGDIGLFAYDTAYVPATLGPSGAESIKARLTFAGQSKHGVVLRLVSEDRLQIIIQDDLTGLVSFKMVAEGHLTE